MYSIYVYKNLIFPDKKFKVKSEKLIKFLAKFYSLITRKKIPICIIKETGNFSKPYNITEWIVPYSYISTDEFKKIERVGEKNSNRDDVVEIIDLGDADENNIIDVITHERNN